MGRRSLTVVGCIRRRPRSELGYNFELPERGCGESLHERRREPVQPLERLPITGYPQQIPSMRAASQRKSRLW
jgi:hypothetical protein